jgi:predicted transcriptional regulator
MFDEFSRYWNRDSSTEKKVVLTAEQIRAMPPRLREIYESIKENDEALLLFEKYVAADAEEVETFVEVWEKMKSARERHQEQKMTGGTP